MSEKINEIEEKLLRRKQKAFVNELMIACKRVADVVNKYGHVSTSGSEEAKEREKWVRNFFKFGWDLEIIQCEIVKVPAYVQKKILEAAIEEFLKSIESTRAIISDLELEEQV